jgi:uncharacterized delta-60 repeat protein
MPRAFWSPLFCRRPSCGRPQPAYRPRLDVLEDRTLLSAGYLDTSFGNAGLAEALIGNSPYSTGERIAVQPDGRLVVAGFALFSDGSRQFALAHYQANGTPDPNFGTNGTILLGPGTGTADELAGLRLRAEANGQILASYGGSLRRFSPNGSADPTFSATGVTRFEVYPDGKVVFVDVVATGNSANPGQEYRVYRLNADGSPDRSFGQSLGYAVTPVGTDVAVEPDGKILVSGTQPASGSSPGGFTVLRLNPDGTTDSTFGQGGQVATAIGSEAASQVLVQSDGKIVVTGTATSAGSTRMVFAAVRYTPDGTLDPAFGEGGQVVAPAIGTIPSGRAVLQGDKLVVLDRYFTAMVRFTTAGQLDPEFGHFGIATTPRTLHPAVSGRDAFDLQVTPDGRLVAVGSSGFGGSPAEMRVLMVYYGDAAIPLGSTPNQRLVVRLYGDLLHRPPDPSGFAFWSGLLDAGASSFSVARALQGSAEYRAVVVRDAYQDLLGRQADPSGGSAWVQFLAQGGTPDQMRAALLGSAEYFQTYGLGNNDIFLNALYHNALNRDVDMAGQSAWDQALAGGASRQDVALAVLGSREADSVLVRDLYGRLLGRAADEGGLNAFTDQLQQGVTDDVVLAELAGSAEYANRAK